MDRRWKDFFMVASFLLASTCQVMANKDVAIKVSELPAMAQRILNVNFTENKVALSKKEVGLFSRSYEVIFTNGNKIEFDADGRWEKIFCERGGVPLELIPPSIRMYIDEHYGGSKIVKIERDKRGYDVKLFRGVNLNFDTKGRWVKVE